MSEDNRDLLVAQHPTNGCTYIGEYVPVENIAQIGGIWSLFFVRTRPEFMDKTITLRRALVVTTEHVRTKQFGAQGERNFSFGDAARRIYASETSRHPNAKESITLDSPGLVYY